MTGGPGNVLVAVIGRPNVGKSTLVNRLAGRREAISHESAGVTRDRIEVPVKWRGRSFKLVDTGGLPLRPRGMESAIVAQARRAIDAAHAILFVVDARVGVTEEDLRVAREMRRQLSPVIVVANKIDSEAQEPSAAELFKLGLGEPVPVSALHGRGTGELLDRLLGLLPAAVADQPPVEDEVRFCLVGRPNVGKSSLFNRLVREERAVVHDQPGTTRDAVDSVTELAGRPVRFIDTAGLRRAVKTRDVEYYGLVRTIRAIDSSHVALLVVDAAQGLTSEDKRIAARVAEAGRGLVAALSKWDLVPSEKRAPLLVDLERDLQLIPGTPVIRTSAVTGVGVTRIPGALLGVHASWVRRVSTAEANRALVSALATHPPPRHTGRILYGTQVSAGPPTFVLFGSGEPAPSYRRYLENVLRREFGLNGVPIRMSFRSRPPRRGHQPGRSR